MKRIAVLLLAAALIAGCGGDAHYYTLPPGGEPGVHPDQNITWSYSEPFYVNPSVDPSILEGRMLKLPPQFVRELENANRKSFGLLEIQSDGVSDEATSEADWGANVGESSVDYTTTTYTDHNPKSGDVILDPDTETNITSNKATPTADSVNDFDSGTYADIGEPNPPNDSDYLTSYGVSGIDHYYRGVFSLGSLISDVPDDAHIVNLRIKVRANVTESFTEAVVYGLIAVEGYGRTSSAANVTGTITDYYLSFDKRPTAGVARTWTKSDLSLIDTIGLRFQVTSATPNNAYVYQIYAEITYYDFKTSGYITVELDLTGASSDGKATITIDDITHTGTSLTYTLAALPSGGTWGVDDVDLGVVEDGSVVDVYSKYRPTAAFSGDGTATGVLKSFGIEIPDRIYRFNSLGERIFNSYPYMSETPGRAIKLDLRTWMTVSSDLSVSMTKDDLVVQMLRENNFDGLNADLYLGMYSEDMTENDLVLVHRLLTKNYTINGESVSLELSDPTSTLLETKVPIGSGTTKPTESYDGDHMVDVILDHIFKAGVRKRYLAGSSFDTLKANVGDGTPASANYVVKRTGVTALKESRPAKDNITELLELLGTFIVVPESGKMTAMEYDSSKAAADDWDVDDFVGDPTWTPGLSEARDVCRVWSDWDGSGSSEDDFGSIYIVLDNTDSTLIKDIKSKWIAGDSSDGYYGDEIAAHVANREVTRLAGGLGKLSGKTDINKFPVQVGDMVNIYHPDIVSPDVGIGDWRKFLVVQKDPPAGDTISWKLVEAR